MSSLELGTTAPVTNVYKLFWASFHQELGELAIEVMGADGALARPGPHPFDALQTMFMYSRAETIYGGSHQIQRNIVGERELGLPREP
jgi:alkylation response protein AidB-like acyl-CoA dehydrogenase